jgi:hypothetical protein
LRIWLILVSAKHIKGKDKGERIYLFADLHSLWGREGDIWKKLMTFIESDTFR